MGSDDVTLKVLIDIRDAVRATNERVDQTNARVDRLTDRVEKLETNVVVGLDDVRRSVVASEARTATAIHELGDTLRSVHTLLKDRLDLRDRVERCEHDIEELKRKIS